MNFGKLLEHKRKQTLKTSFIKLAIMCVEKPDIVVQGKKIDLQEYVDLSDLDTKANTL